MTVLVLVRIQMQTLMTDESVLGHRFSHSRQNATIWGRNNIIIKQESLGL